MTHKTPYELRASLLDLAFQVCKEIKKAENIKKQLDAKATAVVECVDGLTVEEIITTAEKFNEFVSKNEKNKS